MASKKTAEEEVKEQFLKDVSAHKLQIYLSHGVYRHLRLADPKTNCYSFHLITGPGFLLYRGDMGTFEFERIHDMFQFFEPDDCEKLTINPGYWAEKIQATDVDSGHREFDRDYFEAVIKEESTNYLDSKEVPEEIYADFREKVKDDTLDNLYDMHSVQIIQAAMDFTYEGESHSPISGNITSTNRRTTTCGLVMRLFGVSSNTASTKAKGLLPTQRL